jgi:hypothetical protein
VSYAYYLAGYTHQIAYFVLKFTNLVPIHQSKVILIRAPQGVRTGVRIIKSRLYILHACKQQLGLTYSSTGRYGMAKVCKTWTAYTAARTSCAEPPAAVSEVSIMADNTAECD